MLQLQRANIDVLGALLADTPQPQAVDKEQELAAEKQLDGAI